VAKKSAARDSKQEIINALNKLTKDQERRITLIEKEARVLSARRERARKLD
jgi:hypothetical protein